jgi:protein-L-isoaspartate O-methyltransferase
MPSVVMSMLRDLEVEPGMRALEIGTGTGWNCGLLAHRLGSGNVVSIEIDGAVAAQARSNLSAAGLHPVVIRANGELGRQQDAPYDRVVATAGVRRVPPAWLEQTRPGGVILAPWGTHYGNEDALVRLTVAEDGSASGPFLRLVEFMKLKDQRLDWNRFNGRVPEFPGSADQTVTALTAKDLGARYETPRFVTGLCVPECAHVINTTEGSVKAWFLALDSESWACVEFRTGEPLATVHQSGTRRLWDEVERAITWWTRAGRPGTSRFGLSVSPEGRQQPWLDHPENTLDGRLA